MKSFIYAIILGSLVASPSLSHASGNQDAPARLATAKSKTWTLRSDDAKAWVIRIRRLCPAEGWKVFARGNDIVAERIKPVSFGYIDFNQPTGDPVEDSRRYKRMLATTHKGQYRLTLRFSALVGQDGYDKLLAHNEMNRKADYALLRKYQISTRFGGNFSSSGEGAEERLASYKAETAKLIYNNLPHLYSTNQSITVRTSWTEREFLNDKEAEYDCEQTRTRITEPFGLYDTTTTMTRNRIGEDETIN